jgi:hypothetical protein
MGTSLHAQFQRMGIRHVVVCGVTTNHSVAATVRAAAHMGYNALLSSEGTAQINPKLQCVTEKTLEPYCRAILKSTMKISDVIAPSPIDPLHHDQARKSVEDNREAERSMNGGHGSEFLGFDGCDQLTGIGSGDSLYFPDILSNGEAVSILHKLIPVSLNGSYPGAQSSGTVEVSWKPLRFGDQGYRSGGSMPRVVACQASINEDGHVPIYTEAQILIKPAGRVCTKKKKLKARRTGHQA